MVAPMLTQPFSTRLMGYTPSPNSLLRSEIDAAWVRMEPQKRRRLIVVSSRVTWRSHTLAVPKTLGPLV